MCFLFLDPQNEIGPSISSLVVLCSFVLLVFIVMLVLVFYLCLSSVYVHEGLGLIPVPWSSKWNWSVHLFLCRPMCLRPFGLYCNACFGILFVSILCTCQRSTWSQGLYRCWDVKPINPEKKPTATTTAALSANPTPTSTKAKAAWPLGNAAETAADGRGFRQRSSALKLGPFS